MRESQPHCVIEALESRQLRSASLDSAGVIQITGTDTNDTFSVALNAAKARYEVIINATYTLFPKDSVKGVNAMLGLGADSFDGRYCPVKLSVDGEAGNDSIYGGSADDYLVGGLDNDLVDGGEGADSVN